MVFIPKPFSQKTFLKCHSRKITSVNNRMIAEFHLAASAPGSYVVHVSHAVMSYWDTSKAIYVVT